MKSNLYNKKNIILIGGPTASGKSKLAINLANEINGEIINADSMQVYKHFPILTSQPNNADKKKVKHYMYGYFETNKSYNGSKWLDDTHFYIKKILSHNRVPIVVGGTGLYLEFMSQGISLIPDISINTKKIVEEKIHNKGLPKMYDFLTNIDYEYSKKISSNDKLRIIRALEVYFETKKNISFFHKKKEIKSSYNFYKILLSPAKEIIKINCVTRLEKMFKKGLIDEFKANRNKVKNCNISKAIGFQDLNDYYLSNISLLSLSNNIIKNTKNYAKRQFTWFNNRYKPNIKVDSFKNTSLILESLHKIN